MANREVSPRCGTGRGRGIRPVCPRDTGSDECEERGPGVAGGGVRDEPSAGEAREVSSFSWKFIVCVTERHMGGSVLFPAQTHSQSATSAGFFLKT